MPWTDTYTFTDPMIDVRDSDRAMKLGQQLAREISPGHPLHGKEWIVVAEAEPDDEVIATSGDDVVLVHLRWTTNLDPTWPHWVDCPSREEFEEVIKDRY